MVINCRSCKETKYLKYEYCDNYKLVKLTENPALQQRMKIQMENGQNGIYAGQIALLRKGAQISVAKMAQITGCSPEEYRQYESEQKKFDPQIYQKCKNYLKQFKRKNEGNKR